MARTKHTMRTLAATITLMLCVALAPAAAVGARIGGSMGHDEVATAAGDDTVDPPCSDALLGRARPAEQVLGASATTFAAAAAVNGETVRGFKDQAEDGSLWLDECGRSFYVEPAQALSGFEPVAAPASAAPDDVLALQSKPGSARTIYLDFRGGTVSGTAWNSTYNLPVINVEPYSASAPVDTNFSAAEKTAIYNAWLNVAEDYAPFDVNVTTQDPGTAAIDRTSAMDTQYGTRVLITNGGPIYDRCGCAGVAYVGTIGRTADHAAYQPAWAFASGVGTSNGAGIGQVVSHEAGHNFGLNHDGTSASGYYTGSGFWGPIMGSATGKSVSQWSAGEYPDASNTENDLEIISRNAPVRVDDHGNDPARASPLTAMSARTGVVATRSDTDAFSFVAANQATVTVAAPTEYSDLDVTLRILDQFGQTIAEVNPALSNGVFGFSGLGAQWTATLPATPATYTAIVDGTGTGDPQVSGRYSDYASLGKYTISLDSTPTGQSPLSVTSDATITTDVNVAYNGTPFRAANGRSPYAYTATGLPAGWSINPFTGAVTGTSPSPVSSAVMFTVTDSTGVRRTADIGLVVNATAPPTTPTSPTNPPGPSTPGTESDSIGVPDQTVSGLMVGRTATKTITATGAGSQQWNALTPPPAGLTLRQDGRLTGTPTRAGTYSFIARVATLRHGTDAGTITLRVERSAFKVATTRLPPADVGRGYAAKVSVSGGAGRNRWSVKGLPTGMRVALSKSTRTLSLVGRPGAAGRFTIRFAVKDRHGDITTKTLVLRVAP